MGIPLRLCHLLAWLTSTWVNPHCKVFPPTPTNHRMTEHYDVIIIGTGAGGGTLLNRLAPSGKRILVLERGPFLPREKDNWNYHGSFKYYSSEVMFNKEGGEILQ